MNKYLVGVISDTHGLLRPQVAEILKGSDLIIHAGDVGKQHVLEELRAIAPLIAIRGNVDKGEWADHLPHTEVAEIGEILIYILHDLAELDLNPEAAGFQAVISGHSHKAVIHEEKGVLYLNPGSAGPRRFKLPITVAWLQVRGKSLKAQMVELQG